MHNPCTRMHTCHTDILKYIEASAREGDVDSLIVAMDTFCSYYPMYKLSPLKARLLQDIVKLNHPSNILEIGTFFGYSALHIAKSMPVECHLTCVEGSEENAR